MKIAICDDEKAQIEATVTCLEDYMIDRRISIDYECFESYAPLKERLEEYDVFILDYQVPEISGIEFAKALREKYGEEKTVIFLTSFTEIVYESFEVRTHRFLIKPIDKDKFYEALDSYFKTNSLSKKIFIKVFGKTQVVNLDEVIYVEASRKDVYLTKDDDRIKYHKTISELESTLEPLGFFKCHRSFLVNLKRVTKFNSKTVFIDNGETISMGSGKFADFNKAYLRFTK